MKKKINSRLILVAVISTTLTMCSIIMICYSLFVAQVKKDLRSTAQILASAGVQKLSVGETNYIEDEVRITWIDEEGNVLYDNDVAADTMTNHMNRPEVQRAFANGSGESVRRSDTLNMKTFYYAILLEDGTVLRISTMARSMSGVFFQAIPIMLVILVLILVICVFVSNWLTGQLILPIKELADNIDSVPTQTVYRELAPFVDRIREQHEDILASAKSRQDFTANVSHELKTPLTAIAGYAELIENQMVDERTQIKFAGDIRKNADRLVSLINDIIRLSELDQSEAKTEFARIDLYEVALERVELLQGVAEKKGVTLTLAGVSAEVFSRRGMLVELLDNLIENAVRYNVKGGSVTVTIKKEYSHTVLCVKDTGIGIPEAEQERIFERFYRVDKSRSRETGGTGLGLAIVKHIVELHEGKVFVKSEPGKGTEMTIIL